MNTHFESVYGNVFELYGLTNGEYSITLKNAKNEILTNRRVTINYNNKTTTAITDGSGTIYLKTGRYDIGTTLTAVFTFNGDSSYNETTYTTQIKWGNYLNDEMCDDLDKFDTILEGWYGSDGSAKYDLDIDGLNTRDCNKNLEHECNCSPVNDYSYKNILLRNYCNDLETKGDYMAIPGGRCVCALTGVILRSKHVVSSRKCTISFDIYFGYDGSNNKVDSKQYGGHFGLMSHEENITTAEKAPLRFEVYRNNAYGIQLGGSAVGSSMAYSFAPNTWYKVDFEINGGSVKMIMYDEDGKTKGYQSFSTDTTFEGLCPYVFAFTNGTKFALRRLRVSRD